jgi:uncharacterized protein
VVDAPTPELVEQASTKLAAALRQHSNRFVTVSQPGSGSFFERNGLLFLPEDEVARLTGGLSRADDLLGTLAADPSLRGSLDAQSLALIGVDRGDIKLDDLVLPMTMAADTVEAVVAGRPASFSWRVLASGKPPDPQDLRRFIQIQPVLDFRALQPGRAATERSPGLRRTSSSIPAFRRACVKPAKYRWTMPSSARSRKTLGSP